MNWLSWLVWGFGATVVLTGVMSGSQGLGFTRMNLPHMIGTMFTADRDRAKLYGIGLHMVNGLMFSLVYVAAFHVSGRFNPAFGAFSIAGLAGWSAWPSSSTCGFVPAAGDTSGR